MSDELKKSDAVKEDKPAQEVADKDLEKVSGGGDINPQPLPPFRHMPD